jgi:glycosyltransferase involved in cell wall biosynthesis
MIRNLVSGLATLSDLRTTVLTPPNVTNWPAGVESRILAVGNRFLGEAYHVPRVSLGLGADGILFPNYFTAPTTFGVPSMTVVHDLLYRHIPDVFTRIKRLWLGASHSLTVRCATVVVAISQSVADDLCSAHGSAFSDRIVVIPNPIDWSRFTASDSTLPTPLQGNRYILSVAAEWPHKNVGTLVRAFAQARDQLADYKLVLVGQFRNELRGHTRSGARSLSEEIALAGIQDRVVQTGHITDAELGTLYRRAELFVFPSLFEGFGMPPVEALGLGLPVITTRCGALPESTRGLATYVKDPMSAGELAETIITVAKQPHRYAPAQHDIQQLRELYAPGRIAALYRDNAPN